MKSFVAYPFELDNLLFPQQSPAKSSGKLVAHYELFKKVKHLNGAVVKCGITAEEGFNRFAMFRNMMGTQVTQKMIAFQKFQPFFEQEINDDGGITLKVKTRNSDHVDYIQQNLVETGQSQNVDFVPGGVCNSIPDYLIENPELKIAMLNIDLDDYEGTITALEFLYPRLVQNGILILDNYHKNSEERRAVDDYFVLYGPQINSFLVNRGPHYIIKP